MTTTLSLTQQRPEQSDRTGPVVAASLLEGILRATTGTSIIAIDLEGRITFVNRGAEEMLGYQASELLGRTPTEFHDLDELRLRLGDLMPGSAAEVSDAMDAVVDSAPNGSRSDWTYHRKDGHSLTVSLGVTAIMDSLGGVLGYVGIARDVTDDRWAHQLMGEALSKEAEANQRLIAVNQAKNDFIATVGHELRTPLASMLGYTELLREGEGGPLNEHQTRLLSRVESSAVRLNELAENMLTTARVDCESFSLPEESVGLNDVVTAALGGCASIERKGLSVDVRLDPGDPTVIGDVADLQRVVVNLVTNAATYTPDGGRIAIWTRHTESDCYLVVADTGVGIPLGEQEQIFAPFFRSSISHRRAIQGPGVGLSIVKAVVTAHGGEVTVTSDEGEGATFVVRLPSATGSAG